MSAGRARRSGRGSGRLDVSSRIFSDQRTTLPRSPHAWIRVLLDVTHFGIVQDHLHLPSLRAGIYRVIEQTVRSLSAMPGVALTLCARERTDSALAFVEGHDALRVVPFRPADKRIARRLSTRVRAQYDRRGAHPPGALPLRLVNKLAVAANQVLDARRERAGWTVPGPAEVYHSPVYPLPEPRERARRTRYFLTIYDIIPLLFPEFSSWGGDAWLGRILGSIGPDDHLLAISEHSKRDLLDARPEIAPERVHVTLLAADAARFYPCADAERVAAVRARYGVPDAPYVLSVATLEPRKNIAHLVRSFAELVRAERLDDLQLVLTGTKGWDAEAIFAAVGESHHVRDRIVLTGYVADADLAPLYSGALVFVYPSFYEGFGLPPLEAMQCGTPVITSNTSSLPEVVGDAGLMIDPRDGDALAQAILDVYRDSDARADLAARGRARARQFTWERYARQTVDAYRAAL